MTGLRVNAGIGRTDVEVDVFQIILPGRDENLTATLRIDEVEGRCGAARHPTIELTAGWPRPGVRAGPSTAAAAATTTCAVGRCTAPTAATGPASGPARAVGRCTATAAAPAATAVSRHDGGHIHAQFLGLHLHVAVERRGRFDVNAALTSGNGWRVGDIDGLGTEGFQLVDEGGEDRVGAVGVLLSQADAQTG